MEGAFRLENLQTLNPWRSIHIPFQLDCWQVFDSTITATRVILKRSRAMRIFNKLIVFIFGAFLFTNAVAQTDGMSYQAIILDNDPQEIPGLDITGNYLSLEDVSFMFTIYNSEGAYEYQEIQHTQTDKVGMVDLIIGQGEPTIFSTGLWDEIEWDGTPKQLEVQLRYEGADFENLNFHELYFIPYE